MPADEEKERVRKKLKEQLLKDFLHKYTVRSPHIWLRMNTLINQHPMTKAEKELLFDTVSSMKDREVEKYIDRLLEFVNDLR